MFELFSRQNLLWQLVGLSISLLFASASVLTGLYVEGKLKPLHPSYKRRRRVRVYSILLVVSAFTLAGAGPEYLKMVLKH